MGRSSGGGGRGGGGSAAGGSNAAIEEAKKNYKDESSVSGLSDVGNLFYVYGDETDTGSTKANPSMVAAFKRGETNNTPALVVETGVDQYRAVDANSATIMASAKAAGVRAATVVVKNEPKHIKAAQAVNRIQGKGTTFRKQQSKLGLSDFGNLVNFDGSKFSGGSSQGYTKGQVNRAALSVLRNNSRQWAPIRVRETGGDNYQVIGSRFGLDVARAAGTRPWFVIVD